MGRAVAIGCQRFFWSSGLGASEAVAAMDRWTAARVSGVKWSKVTKQIEEHTSELQSL